MKIGKKNINRFFPNYINRKKEIEEQLTWVANKIMQNSIYGSANYIVCSSSLVNELKDGVNK